MTYQEIKEAYAQFMASKIGVEISSAFHTFTSIFVGTLIFAPAINALANTDLPTIQQLKDIFPVVVDTIYRSLWMTLLIRSGLSKLRK